MTASVWWGFQDDETEQASDKQENRDWSEDSLTTAGCTKNNIWMWLCSNCWAVTSAAMEKEAFHGFEGLKTGDICWSKPSHYIFSLSVRKSWICWNKSSNFNIHRGRLFQPSRFVCKSAPHVQRQTFVPLQMTAGNVYFYPKWSNTIGFWSGIKTSGLDLDTK